MSLILYKYIFLLLDSTTLIVQSIHNKTIYSTAETHRIEFESTNNLEPININKDRFSSK